MNENLIILRKKLLESQHFCFYPFMELSTNPAGHVKPCCYYGDVLFNDPNSKDYSNSLSLAKGDTLEEVWNSPSMVEIRRKLVEGEHNPLCATCYRDGAASMRVRSLKENKERIPIIKLVQDSIDNGYKVNSLPTRLELKPSNLCNLKCVMCNRYDSTQIEKELKELSEKYNGINVKTGRFISINLEKPGITELHKAFTDVETADWSNNPDLWDSLIKIIPGLEHLSFAGGEPTLIPLVEKILRYCIETGHAEHIEITIASNFTNINKSFLELMSSFKKFEIISSIDAFGKVNEYARYPSKWSQVSSNYEKVKQLADGRKIKLMTNITVNLLTVVNVDQLLYWIEDQVKDGNHFAEHPYNINLIWAPWDQRVEHLPQHYKQIAIHRLKEYKKKSFILQKWPAMVSKIDLIIRELAKESDNQEFHLSELKKRINILDDHRGINIGDYIPEIADIFR